MKALKIALIPALLALFAGVAMANDAPPDAKAAAKDPVTAPAKAKVKKHHHAKKASVAKTDAPEDAKAAEAAKK